MSRPASARRAERRGVRAWLRRLILLMASGSASAVGAQTTAPGEWTTVWYVRFVYQRAPGVWQTLDVSAEDYRYRDSAVAKRDEIIAHGWARPALIGNPGIETGEVRIAPGAVVRCSVKRMLCRLDLPPTERPACQYPDGDPPGAPEPSLSGVDLLWGGE